MSWSSGTFAQYSLDFLLMAAQGYQESRLDHSAKSPVGAIGIMQVMPATGQELRVGDIKQLEPNIHAGAKASLKENEVRNDRLENHDPKANADSQYPARDGWHCRRADNA